MKKNRMISAVVLGMLLILVAIAVTAPRDRSLTELQEAGRIRIGYAVEAPYLFLKPGGDVTGAEAEVAKVIVDRLGIERIEWRLYEFRDLLFALENNQIDAIVAGMFITPERAEHAIFSEPTFHVQQGLLVAVGNPQQLYSYQQAATLPGIKIAVLSGSVEEAMFKSLGLPASQLVRVPDALTGRVSVETGLADALALSIISIRWMAGQDQLGRTESVQPLEQTILAQNKYFGYGAVVFRQSARQLRSAWNVELKSFLGGSEHLRLIVPFGFSNAELPGTVTTQEILLQP